MALCGLEGDCQALNGLGGKVDTVRAGGAIVTVQLDDGRRFNTRRKNLVSEAAAPAASRRAAVPERPREPSGLLQKGGELPLEVGCFVEIVSLEGKNAGMNGARGTVEMIRASGQIVTVLVEGSNMKFNTRGRNLKVLPP